MINRTLPLGLALFSASALSAQAIVLFSTDFSAPTAASNLHYTDTLDSTNTANRAVAWAGGTNWTKGDATRVDFAAVPLVDFGNYEWRGSGGNTNIAAGVVWTTFDDGRYNTGTAGAGTNSAIRLGGATGAMLQFNTSAVGSSATSAPADIANFNLVFEIKSSTWNAWSVSMRAGTAQTSGAWDNNNAGGNGSYRISIFSLTSGVVSASPALSFSASAQAIGAGAGPTVVANASNAAAALGPGLYLLELQFLGKTTNQRYSIDDLAISATAVPEPSAFASLAGLCAIGFAVSHRRRSR